MRHQHAPNPRKGSVSLPPFGFARCSGFALFVLLPTGAWAHSQSLPVSDPYEILASDPAAFIQLLDDFRPSPVTSETKQRVLKSLPLELMGRAVNARDRAKLEGLYPVLRAVQRDAAYEIRVIQSPSATIAIDGRAVLLISERALGVLDADQLRAAVAHEAAHEYVWEEWQRADKRDDWKRLRELELVCDGIAIVILQQLGLETSSLIQGFEKLTYLNLLWLGSPPNPSRYPMLAERREFAREVAAWIAGARNSDGDHVLFQDTTAQTATPTRDRAPTPESNEPATSTQPLHEGHIVGFRSGLAEFWIGQAIRDAARLLRSPECRRVLTDFTDASGNQLETNLVKLSGDPGDYVLHFVQFADGSAHRQCGGNAAAAFTQPGSRVIFVCGAYFGKTWRVGDAEVVIIHEILHSLGLGENPPSSDEITKQVLTRCGGRRRRTDAQPGGQDFVRAVLFQDTTAQTATPTRDRAPTPESKWSRVYIDDGYVRDAVVRSLDGAAEWLNAAKCQSLLSEFADQQGRPLHERLAALNMTLATYLGVLIFDDGEARPQCERSGILAFTAAGSRVVRVCGRAFARAWQREPLEGRAAIVHEMLHTLGLGENPPEPRFITYRVKELCW